jgi:hypothetical protein
LERLYFDEAAPLRPWGCSLPRLVPVLSNLRLVWRETHSLRDDNWRESPHRGTFMLQQAHDSTMESNPSEESRFRTPGVRTPSGPPQFYRRNIVTKIISGICFRS